MKHFFVDTNILIDFLAARKPYSEQSAQLFELANKGKIKLYAASISFNNVYYILRQSLGHKGALSALRDLKELTILLNVTGDIVTTALNADFSDFEDAIQYFTALSNQKTEAIVTRNIRDFKKSLLPVLLPDEALKMIHKIRVDTRLLTFSPSDTLWRTTQLLLMRITKGYADK